MLGNEVALWEVHARGDQARRGRDPGHDAADAGDLRDRVERGGVRHVVAQRGERRRSSTRWPATFTRIAVGDARRRAGTRYEDAHATPPTFTPDGATRASDPLLLYFTSGTTAKPKLVLHTHQSYPVGHLSTMYWIGLQPGDVH